MIEISFESIDTSMCQILGKKSTLIIPLASQFVNLYTARLYKILIFTFHRLNSRALRCVFVHFLHYDVINLRRLLPYMFTQIKTLPFCCALDTTRWRDFRFQKTTTGKMKPVDGQAWSLISDCRLDSFGCIYISQSHAVFSQGKYYLSVKG